VRWRPRGERRRIARELHDEIGQSLTAVLLGLKRTVDRGPEHLRDELHVVQEGIRTALDEVRQVARRLRPGVLEDLGSGQCAERARRRVLRQRGPGAPDPVASPVPLGPDAELVVYRIAQESLTNVGRHARAGTVELSLHAEGDRVVLGVVDDGCGVGAAGGGRRDPGHARARPARRGAAVDRCGPAGRYRGPAHDPDQEEVTQVSERETRIVVADDHTLVAGAGCA
jgi:two-component system sensor histidine kinase UhpB